MEFKSFAASALFLGLTLASCSRPSTSDTEGYVSRNDDRWQTKAISVCFTQGDPVLNNAKSIIARGLNEEYGKIGFQFSVNANCIGTERIQATFVNGAASQVDQIGSGVRRVSLGVGHPCTTASGQRVDYLNSNCVRNVAIHEFGHAVGLHHEMNRRDNDDRCDQDQTNGAGESGAIQLGDYDSSSVMNYCQVMRMNDRNQLMPLSQGDLNTLRAIYEGPVASVDYLPAARLSSLEQINFRVRGTNVTEFQLKFGHRDRIDCKSTAGYSPFLPVSYQNTGAEMVQEFLEANESLSGDFRICLIGRSAQRTQPLVSYSSIDVSVP